MPFIQVRTGRTIAVRYVIPTLHDTGEQGTMVISKSKSALFVTLKANVIKAQYLGLRRFKCTAAPRFGKMNNDLVQ